MSNSDSLIYNTDPQDAASRPILIIKKQFVKFPGMHIRIFSRQGRLLSKAYALPFRLREHIDIFSDEAKQYKILTANTTQIIDWNVVFTIKEARSKKILGSLRRHGISSEFARDRWKIFNQDGQEVGELVEDSLKMGLIRRFLLGFLPQIYHVKTADSVLTIKQSWNPILLHYKVYCPHYGQFKKAISEQFLLGILTTIAVIEGRQR